MAIFKCKMCGGNIEFNPGESIGTCDSCASVQTLPKGNDDIITNLFNRANNLRIKAEFDKAAEIYEKIVDEDNTNAEAHWGLVLCKYGIEYVEDPTTHKRIPTCHRAQYESIMTDADYVAALENSDTTQQGVYTQHALEISSIQKGILAIVKDEKPFDVFICYKESDENGKRTVDSALANDIYYQLTQEGLKVFYAAITLEDKLGQEYEPYIFAALNSSKVMLVVGTKPEYFEAVWVKNEWSRFLKIMKNDRSKLLIPCYRDMDAYDLPEEFAHLQAQDMSKIGFINDVVRGVKKVIEGSQSKTQTVKETVVVNNAGSSSNSSALLKRAFMFLAVSVAVCAVIGVSLLKKDKVPESEVESGWASVETIEAIQTTIVDTTKKAVTTLTEATVKEPEESETASIQAEITTEKTEETEVTYSTTTKKATNSSNSSGTEIFESYYYGVRVVAPKGTTQNSRGWYETPIGGHINIHTKSNSGYDNAYDYASNYKQLLYGKDSTPYEMTLAGKTFYCRNFINSFLHQVDSFYMVNGSALIIHFYDDNASYEEIQNMLKEYVKPY
jgi:hypothetical protein